MTQWSDDMHARIARAIKSARGTRSAQWLADSTATLGHPVSRAQIANYESGRKKSLDIPELVVIAAALGVPPVALLYPDLPDGEVEILPGENLESDSAVRWFSGESDWGEENLAKLLMYARERRLSIEYVNRLASHLDAFKEGETNPDDIVLLQRMLDGVEDFSRRMREIPGSVVESRGDDA
ncbi:hypothetical protein P5W04_07870 [Mycobacteroides abscessus subsp. abscessus]|nr:hypothetical protein [Mycobacteroides abscessus subsp. abscessus]